MIPTHDNNNKKDRTGKPLNRVAIVRHGFAKQARVQTQDDHKRHIDTRGSNRNIHSFDRENFQ